MIAIEQDEAFAVGEPYRTRASAIRGWGFGLPASPPEGLPTKVIAAQQKKLPDEMQKRADEARKKLKGQGTASASTR
jgi:hypothetical protein